MTKILVEIDPESQRVVPVEPTDEILIAAYSNHYRLDTKLGREYAIHDYKAGIAAAKQPEPVSVEPVYQLRPVAENWMDCSKQFFDMWQGEKRKLYPHPHPDQSARIAALIAALSTFLDSHEECTDFDGFTAQIVSMDDYHAAQEALTNIKEALES